jgi:hypothetical protein
MKMIGAIILPQPFLDKIFPNNFTTKGSEASTHGQIKSWWPDNNEILTGKKIFRNISLKFIDGHYRKMVCFRPLL